MNEGPLHGLAGTNYGIEGAAKYASVRHGPDGILLDPFFLSYITDLHGEKVIDIGAGAAPWSIYAARHGAGQVIAVDYQLPMLDNAIRDIQKENVNGIEVLQADAAHLPLPSGIGDIALSINVGCNLPNTKLVKFDGLNNAREVGFGPHFEEAFRVLRTEGKFVVTAPTNFGTVFTDGSVSEQEMIAKINSTLKSNPPKSKENALEIINSFTSVYRATFAWRGSDGESKLQLITDEGELISGEDILRKLPGLTVPNRYHHEEDYIVEAKRAGFIVKEVVRKSFSSEEERQEHNNNVPEDKRLGPEYVGKSPFTVFVFSKPKSK